MLYRSGEPCSPLQINFIKSKNCINAVFGHLMQFLYLGIFSNDCGGTPPTAIFNFPFSNFNLKNFRSGIYTLALIRLSSRTGNGGSPLVLLTIVFQLRRGSAVFGLAKQNKRINIWKTVFNRRLSDGDFFVSQIINCVFKANLAKIL